MSALQSSFSKAFSLLSQLGENGPPVASSSESSGEHLAINELSQIIEEAESVISYSSWIFNITTTAFGLCALSLVCSYIVF